MEGIIAAYGISARDIRAARERTAESPRKPVADLSMVDRSNYVRSVWDFISKTDL